MNNNTNSNQFPFLSILQLIFITLKLIGYIDWSWWWVLSPTWGLVLLIIVLTFFVYIVFKK